MGSDEETHECICHTPCCYLVHIFELYVLLVYATGGEDSDDDTLDSLYDAY